jgi:23S rRNA pseudouridine1911/1915/1917 synthase
MNTQLIVTQEFDGQRLDYVVAQMLPEYSRSQLAQLIKSGAILLNQRHCKPKEKTVTDDVIVVNITLLTEAIDNKKCQPEDIPLNIIFEDDELLVINKPAGLVVHPGAGNQTHTLVNALLYHAQSQQHLPRAGIVHRLDKDTTGLLLVAKTHTTHTALIRQMQAREIKRHYITLVQGHLISGGTIDTYFGRHPRNRLKMAVLNYGRKAVTHYTITKQYQALTLLDVSLMTGRTHQIRVHLAHINHPVVGDPLYSGRSRHPKGLSDTLRAQLHEFKRQALHASSISFFHPKTGQELTFTAPLPDDFNQLLLSIEAEL